MRDAEQSEWRRIAGNICIVLAAICCAVQAIDFVFMVFDAKTAPDNTHTAIFNAHVAIYFVRPFEKYLPVSLIPLLLAIGFTGCLFRGPPHKWHISWEPRKR
jgi:hypothetical protein